MNRNSLNKLASFLAIFSGIAVILLSILSAPQLGMDILLDWKFLSGFAFIGVGIYSLLSGKK